MNPLIYDSHAGRVLQALFRGRLSPYREEWDTSLQKRFSLDARSSDSVPHEPAQDEGAAEKGEQDPTCDANIVTWYGLDDPENPQNWPNMVKYFVTFQICFLTFAVYVGSSIYSPGTEEVAARFSVGDVVATLGLTTFVLGIALGPMTLAPVAEMPSVGQSPVYIWTLVLFVLCQVPTALSTNIAMLVIFRFVGGVLGSPALAIGGASITEMYQLRARSVALAFWGLSAVCGPSLGPVIGGYATETYGWRWTIWSLMIISAGALLLLFMFLPETSAKNILARRAARLRRLTGNSALTTQAELEFQHVTVKKIALKCIVRPWVLTFTEPIVCLLNMWTALVFGILFIWFYSIPLVFQSIYGFSLASAELAFLALLIGTLVFFPPLLWYLVKIQGKFFDEKGRMSRPEMRLPPAMVGGLFIAVCLFWFGWTSNKQVHWIVPMLGTSLFSAGVVYILTSILNYLPDTYPADIASVMSGNAFIRFAAGGAFPLFAPAMFSKLGVHWATTLLALLALLFATLPFLFYVYGKRIRNASKCAKHD